MVSCFRAQRSGNALSLDTFRYVRSEPGAEAKCPSVDLVHLDAVCRRGCGATRFIEMCLELFRDVYLDASGLHGFVLLQQKKPV